MLLILRLIGLLDHLAATVATTAFTDAMRAHQLVAGLAGYKRRRIQALMLAAVATAVARDFCFWCGTHCSILNPFLACIGAGCGAGCARPTPGPDTGQERI